MLTGPRVTIAALLSIAVVFGLAGWRFLAGDSPPLPSVRPPVIAAAKPQAAAAPGETSTALNQLDLSQQFLVDDLQLLQGRVTTQEAEIRRLKTELLALSQKYETLSSFASSPKEAKQTPDVQPPKKKKKRLVNRAKKKR